MEQELSELRASLKEPSNSQLSQKFGDLLFILVNLARLAKVHPETALAGSNKKFELRFKKMEDLVVESERDLDSIPLKEKVRIWEMAKKMIR